MDENREERFYDLLEADENDAEAQYQIGLCYLNGDGTDKDTQKAETYFRRASELGHAAAAEMLGKDSIADQSPNTENVSLPELCLRAEREMRMRSMQRQCSFWRIIAPKHSVTCVWRPSRVMRWRATSWPEPCCRIRSIMDVLYTRNSRLIRKP